MIHSVKLKASCTSLIFALICVLCAGSQTFAQSDQTINTQEPPLASINYRLKMSRPASHLFEVGIEVEKSRDARSDFIDFQMPAWSPGRYSVFNFAKNVQEFRAQALTCLDGVNCQTGPAKSERIDHQTWRVYTGGVKRFAVSYKVFGNDLSGTFSQLDMRHANYNGASVFMYLVGHKQDPVALQIEPPAGWRIVNGQTTLPEQREFKFPNYDILIDTPTEIAPDWTVDEFKVDGKTYRVVVHSFGEEGGKRAAFVRNIEKIVRAEVRMWGAPDFESYTFIIHFAADDHSADGMEHLNSTQIISPGVLSDPGMDNLTLDTVAHEFFHVWNVKRLRPAELGPWDFTRPVRTRSLWIAEGVTNYYGQLMMRRAEVWSNEQFFNTLGEYIGGVENSQGSRLMSAEESSLSASLLDRSISAQRTNLANSSISYYPKGEVLGLVLDLLIRGKTGGKASLDDVMRRMYEEFYVKSPNASYYLRGRGYTPEDFERVASEVAGTDLKDFFARYVRATEVPPYDEALAHVGLRLVREVAREPHTAGITVDWEDRQKVKILSVSNDSLAEAAALSQGDIILSIGKTKVTPQTWRTVLNRYQQGARVPITVRRDRRTIKTVITLGQPDRYAYRVEEIQAASPEALRLREAWLKG
jgi:predicted metalloprotease with PDZ domain